MLVMMAVFILQATAQKGQPGFGKVDKEDLLMKDCAFDKGADAMI